MKGIFSLIPRAFVTLFIPIIAFVIPFSVYLYTLSPTISPGDSVEMVTAAIVLGVPHQPSYPVNTILGHIGYRLPIPLDDVERANAVSAFFQALTVVVFYFLVVRLLSYVVTEMESGGGSISLNNLSIGIRVVALAASQFLAFSLIFWTYATKFEVFALNNFLVVLILLITASIGLPIYKSKRSDKSTKSILSKLSKYRDDIGLLLLIFLVGFAFGHHQTIILIFPSIIFVLRKQVIRVFGNVKLFIASLASLILGIVPFFALLIWIAKKKPLLNWGEIEGIKGAFYALTRRDFGTFQSFLVGSEPTLRPAPIDHIEYYLKNIVTDFSIVGIIFILLGVWFVWKKVRDIFWFIFTGVFVSGFLFLMYASFPLTDSFNQATVRRFHMMPNIFVSLFLAFGIFFLYQAMTSKRVKKLEYKAGVMLGKSYLILAFLFVILVNFSKANHREERMTLDYTYDSFSMTPPNSLILLSGDIPNMTADYFAFVDPGENKRIIFSPGQFHLDWFNKQMSVRHPQVAIPPARPGKRFTTTTQVIDANYGKWPIYVGPDLVVHDPELEERYVLYPKHLLFLVKRPGEDLNVEELREENKVLWENIDLEEVSRIKKNTPRFEETILFHYSRHFFNTGFMYEEVGLYDDAVREYERVLEIDPVFKEAYLGLARISGEKKEEKDYAAAIGYMQMYQSALRPGEEDLAYAAEAEIYKFYEAAQKQAEEEAKLAEIEKQGEEATGSGDVKIDISRDKEEKED